ncbi:dihydrofolate synthase/folylpolyglutamate synthase [Altererythrobacter atlanticus]|uniref:Folylpolyglutamate synthase n=1 Tax=Croceibacterium atlanticum TaxID=1267766 RepID=A0A0F7KQ44_9SPHN|nr:folylpolyglutamate synthase/dihydrofolate synthase family protein [Croceibacterium atlanticum]AKH41252.1 Folylpolyglutamate synthase [Croceibacterium atlanticum]MBB5732770.1 dihydrofolate synthase/folylpolyglutamate synthase [Croceibacterium atlanticum]
MKDFAASEDPAVQAQLDRLAQLSLPQGRIGLEVVHELLRLLGDPQNRLPPVFHVAGTNGKGSTCAYLRAILEADGKVVHTATKPHLVRYNERIRLAGELVSDAELASLLKEVLDIGESLGPSFFEVTTAATFLAFSRHPADACVIEVGLGGRLDATNVMERPAACGIATLGIDHEAFLLVPEPGAPEEPMVRIAFEKAGIARPGSPLITQSYREDMALEIERIAGLAGAPLHMRGRDWWAEVGQGKNGTIEYRDRFGELTLPLPALPGRHQGDNAALAVALLRHQDEVNVSPASMAEGIRTARWPARMQLLGQGPLSALVPGREVWLDGGHNVDAGLALGRHFAETDGLHLIIGMLSNRYPDAILDPLKGKLKTITAVPIDGSDAHGAESYADKAVWAPDIMTALKNIPDDGLPVLIAGSLYLAGKVLQKNEEVPD